MFCSHCGAEAAEGAGFCSNCGRGLASAVATLPAPESPSPQVSPTDAAATLAAAKAESWNQPEGKPFLHGGSWYARQGHTLLQWDTAAGAWSEARVATAADPRPEFTPLTTPAVFLYVILGLFALVSAIAVGIDIDAYATFDDLAEGRRSTRGVDRDALLENVFAVKGFQVILYLSCVPFFLWWVRRATCNVKALGASDPEFSPGWAIGWWFIPFANWVQPLRVLNQAWRASNPSLPTTPGDDWRRTPLTPLLPIWWIAWLVGFGAWSGVWSSIDDASMSHDTTSAILAAMAVLDTAVIAITGLTIWVVVALTARQGRANARFDATG